MTRILHLETATKVCSAGLSINGELVQLFEIADDAFSHGEQLTLLIEKIIEAQHITLKDISAVSISEGPGSYTGLRIGVSTAKGLCYALKIPLISVNTIESMVHVAHLKHPNNSLCAMIDARRMEVYSGIFSADLKELKIVSADVLDEFSYNEFEPFVFFGDGSTKMETLWKNRNVIWDPELQPSASGQVKIAYEKFQHQQFEDVAYFEPNYIKAFYTGTLK